MLLKTYRSRVTWVLCDKHAIDTHLYNIFRRPRCPALLVLISKWEDIMGTTYMHIPFVHSVWVPSDTFSRLWLFTLHLLQARLTCRWCLAECWRGGGHNSVGSVRRSSMKCEEFIVPHSWTHISCKCGSDCFLLQHLFGRDNQHMRFRGIYKMNSSNVYSRSFYLNHTGDSFMFCILFSRNIYSSYFFYTKSVWIT